MAADLHIHAMTDDMTERDLAEFFSHTLGTKWFNLAAPNPDTSGTAWQRVTDSPNVWVGEVSWLGAGLTGDYEDHVPDVVGRVREAVGDDLPMIDDTLIGRLHGCFFSSSGNAAHYDVTGWEKVGVWLEEHRGMRAFTVSW